MQITIIQHLIYLEKAHALWQLYALYALTQSYVQSTDLNAWLTCSGIFPEIEGFCMCHSGPTTQR